MFLQLSGQKFINLNHVAAVEFGPEKPEESKDYYSTVNSFAGYQMAYEEALIYWYQPWSRDHHPLRLRNEDAKILRAYFDQHRDH